MKKTLIKQHSRAWTSAIKNAYKNYKGRGWTEIEHTITELPNGRKVVSFYGVRGKLTRSENALKTIKARKELGLKQAEAADKLNMARSTLCLYETGAIVTDKYYVELIDKYKKLNTRNNANVLTSGTTVASNR